jgi:hypothetical protein
MKLFRPPPAWQAGEDSREAITDWLAALVRAGQVRDRKGVVNALRTIGEVTRQGEGYVSVRPAHLTRAVRLWGGFYVRCFGDEAAAAEPTKPAPTRKEPAIARRPFAPVSLTRAANVKRADLIPIMSSGEARGRHQREPWLMFARRMQRHPYVRSFLMSRDSGHCCPCCDQPLWLHQRLLLHHTDYDHHCQSTRRVEFPTPSERNPNRTFRGPDCEACHAENPAAFNSCVSRLVMVHGLCNARIEQARSALEDL